jgi:hypothetical protein
MPVDLDKIVKIENIRKKIRKEIYTQIYEQFSRKIMHAAQTNQKQLFLVVPAYLIGYPVFDRDKATVYLKRQLELNKLNVIQIAEFEFHVSWNTKKKKEKEKKEEEEDDDDHFPTLINLKKAAAKYK